VVLLITALAPMAGAQRSHTRDLLRYENGGTFDFNWDVAPKHEEMRRKLREFVWERWSQKRQAFVVATFYSYHGDYTKHRLFVEPDREGRWSVVSEYETECCVLKRKIERRKGKEIYHVVERLEEMGNGMASTQVIPDRENREGNMYRLRLRRSPTENSGKDPFLL